MATKAIQECIEKQGIKRDLDVEELYLAKSNINEAPDLARFKNLQRLWLKDNKLHRMQGLDNNYHLTELYLQNNMLTEINGSMQHLTCLQILFLHGNQLTVLTDVIHEMRNMLGLKNLNLFGNPLTQECDYRMYVVHSIKSLQILDRQAINREEREKSQKKYEIARQSIKETIAFGRRTTAEKDEITDKTYSYSIGASCIRNTTSNKYSSAKQVQYLGSNSSCLHDYSSTQDGITEAKDKSASDYKDQPKRSLMQFNSFGWVDILDARSKSKDTNAAPSIYTTKFR